MELANLREMCRARVKRTATELRESAVLEPATPPHMCINNDTSVNVHILR